MGENLFVMILAQGWDILITNSFNDTMHNVCFHIPGFCTKYMYLKYWRVGKWGGGTSLQTWRGKNIVDVTQLLLGGMEGGVVHECRGIEIIAIPLYSHSFQNYIANSILELLI